MFNFNLIDFFKNLIDDCVNEWHTTDFPGKVIVFISLIAQLLLNFLYIIPIIQNIFPREQNPLIHDGLVTFVFLLVMFLFLAFILKIVNISNRIIHYLILFLTILIIIIGSYYLYKNNFQSNELPDTEIETETFFVEKEVSFGENFLITEISRKCKEHQKERLEIQATTNLETKKNKYRNYLNSSCPNDPEARIYFSNLNIDTQNDNNKMAIAVAVPITRENGKEDSQEILRGVALAQDEWNKSNQNLQLSVGIADDNDNGDVGINVAQSFVNNQNILGVIAHFSSGVTEQAAPIYDKNNLVAISPTSTVIRNIPNDNYDECIENKERIGVCLNSSIFRTSSNDEIHSKILVRETTKNAKFAIVYTQDSLYSRSFKSIFVNKMVGGNDIVDIEEPQKDYCNFSIENHKNKPEKCLLQAQENGANTLLLVIPSSKAKEYLEPLLEANSLRSSEERFDLLGSDSIYKSDFAQNINTEGMLVAVPWHRQKDLCSNGDPRLECKAANLFRINKSTNSQQNRYEPLKINWRTATAYDAALALLNGIKISNDKCNVGNISSVKRNTCIREKVQNELLSDRFKQSQFEGALGIISFDKKGDRLDNDQKLGEVVEVKNGTFEPAKS